MEFIGVSFLVLFCCILEVYALAALFSILLIIGLLSLIPEEKRPAVKRAGGVLLILTSIVLLMSV